MPYIGKEPVAGNFVLLDSITTSATATYALTKDSVAYSPESARNMIVSLNGVTQAPETAFTVSGSNITFSSALTSSDVIDYILVLGDVLSVGTPSDGTVGTSQMSYPLDNFSSTGIDDNATSTAITIDSSENVGIGTTTPVSLGAGYKNLDIRHTTGGGVTLGDTSNIHAYLFSDNNGVTLQSPGSRSIKFTTVSTERMRIDASGNVGIGTSSPLQLLHISKASADNYIRLGSNGANDAGIYFNTGTDWTIGTDTSNSNAFDLSNSSSVGGASKVVVTTGGNVGIGVTSLFSPGGSRRLLQISNSTNGAIIAMNNNTDESLNPRIFSDSANLGFATPNTGSGVFQFYTAGAERMRIDSYGGLDIKSVAGNTSALFGGGNVVNGITGVPSASGTPFVLGRDTGTTRSAHFGGHLKFTSGYGIDFDVSGGSGSVSSNVLDDYEEGTWTPGISSGSATFYDATYTKVGRLVHLSCLLISMTDLSSTTNLQITGLPFTSNSSTFVNSVGLSRYINRGNGTIVAYMGGNSNVVNFYALSAGADYLVVRHADLNNANANYYLNFTYQTT